MNIFCKICKEPTGRDYPLCENCESEGYTLDEEESRALSFRKRNGKI